MGVWEFCLFGVLSLWVFCLSSSDNEFPIRTLGKQSRLSAFTISRSRRSWQWKGTLVPEFVHSFRSFSSYEYKYLKNYLCLWIHFFEQLHQTTHLHLHKPLLPSCLYMFCNLTQLKNQLKKSIPSMCMVKSRCPNYTTLNWSLFSFKSTELVKTYE